MSTEIRNLPAHADALTVADMRAQVQLIQGIMQAVMQENEHYGAIPGTRGKPTLLKAGAEKLSHVFRLVPEYKIDRIDLPDLHREYIVTCRLIHATSGTFQGEGVGSCSTMEKKYRYRKVNGRSEENTDIADTYNTVLKMAKKRAHVDAILTATAASDIFTQDLEDMPREEPPPGQKARKPSGDGHNAPAAPAPIDYDAQINQINGRLKMAAQKSEREFYRQSNLATVYVESWPAEASHYASRALDLISDMHDEYERANADSATATSDAELE